MSRKHWFLAIALVAVVAIGWPLFVAPWLSPGHREPVDPERAAPLQPANAEPVNGATLANDSASRTAVREAKRPNSAANARQLSGRISNEDGVALAHGSIRVLPDGQGGAPDVQSFLSADTDREGRFELSLDGSSWPNESAVAYVFDAEERFLARRDVRITTGVHIHVSSRRDASRVVSGTIAFPSHATPVAGKLAIRHPNKEVYWATCKFDGNPAALDLNMLAERQRITGLVAVEVSSEDRAILFRHVYDSIDQCAAAIKDGIEVETVSQWELEVAALPTGGFPERIAVAEASQSPFQVKPMDLDENGRVQCHLASNLEYKTYTRDGETDWHGVVRNGRCHWLPTPENTVGQDILVRSDSGAPVVGARVSCVLNEPGSPWDGLWTGTATATDSDGRTTMLNLVPGSYRVHVVPANAHQARAWSTVEVPKNGEIRLELPSSTTCLVVPTFPEDSGIDTFPHPAIAPLRVFCREPHEAEWKEHEVLPYRNLEYLRGLPPRVHELVCYAPPYAGRRTVDLRATEEVQRFTVRMQPGEVVTGQVVSSEGAPVADRWVSANAESRDGQPIDLPFSRGLTTQEGRFELFLGWWAGGVINVWNRGAAATVASRSQPQSQPIVVDDN